MLPDVIVIGAMKCATTSLHALLGHHPDVAMVAEKELHFFVAERNWPRGLAWYERQFGSAAALRGESSTTYTRFPLYAGVPARMHSVVPRARLIYIVREPVERVVSHWVHEYAARREHVGLSEALSGPAGKVYLDLSRYAMQLEQYLEFYPREHILVLTAEELDERPADTMRRVYRFVGVRDDVPDGRLRARKHESRGKRRLGTVGSGLAWVGETALARALPPAFRRGAARALSVPFSRPVPRPIVDPDLRRRLQDALAPDAERFARLTGITWPDGHR